MEDQDSKAKKTYRAVNLFKYTTGLLSLPIICYWLIAPFFSSSFVSCASQETTFLLILGRILTFTPLTCVIFAMIFSYLVRYHVNLESAMMAKLFTISLTTLTLLVVTAIGAILIQSTCA